MTTSFARRPARHAQRGSVLMISLIMLVVLTLLAVSAINISSVGLRTVNGMQMRSEAMSVAQRAVERFLTINFTSDIGSIAGNYSIAIDAGKSYDATLVTPCMRQILVIKNSELKLADAEDAKCYDTTTNPWSACANTVWQFSSSVNDAFTGANATLIQGVAIRMDSSSALAYQVSTAPVYTCP